MNQRIFCQMLVTLVLLTQAAVSQEPNPAWHAESDQPDAFLGVSVSNAGDVNGDGFGDVIVGASNFTHDQPNEGAAFVWYGGSGGLGANGTPTNAAWSAEGNQSGSDLNGDGFNFSGSGFGRSVASAGDVNHDGYDDVLVSALFFDQAGVEDSGKVFLYLGSAAGLSSTPAWTASGGSLYALFGESVAGIGDVNGDGFDDIAISAPGCPFLMPCFFARPAVFVWFGGHSGGAGGPSGLGPNGTPGNADWETERDADGFTSFGSRVAPAGDLNGDGFADLVISQNTGVAVYMGGSGGLSGRTPPPGSSFVPPAWETEDLGLIVNGATAGDVNGDGFGDLVVGVGNILSTGALEGRALVWLGGPSDAASGNISGLGPTGTLANADWMSRVIRSDSTLYGLPVISAGDVNGDSYSDLVIGASAYGEGVDDLTGKVFVWYGNPAFGESPTMLNADESANWTALGTQAGGQFGFSTSTAGDVNGDGASDIIAGAWRQSFSESHEGRAYVFLGIPLKPFSNPGIKGITFDWAKFITPCLELPGMPWSDPGFGTFFPKPNCPPPSECPECFRAFSSDKSLPVSELRLFSQMYRNIWELHSMKITKRNGKEVFRDLARSLSRVSVGANFTPEKRSSVLNLLSKGKRDAALSRALLEAANSAEIDVRFPKLQPRQIRRKPRAGVTWRGVASLSFSRVEKPGSVHLQIRSGIPGTTPDLEPPWPVVRYDFNFTGAVDPKGYIDVSIPIREFRFSGPSSKLKLLQFDGTEYRDITANVDVPSGIIWGRTHELSTFVIMSSSISAEKKRSEGIK